jgi:signal transduction histidine kinase/CheY-like chemotaxis protein
VRHAVCIDGSGKQSLFRLACLSACLPHSGKQRGLRFWNNTGGIEKIMHISSDSNSAAEPLGLRLHWVKLNFLPSESPLERLFWNRYFENNLQHVRLCHFYTILFYSLVSIIDYAFFPKNLAVLLDIRFFLVVPIFILGYVFSYAPAYRRCWQEIHFGYILLTGGSFIAFTVMTAEPKVYAYHLGLVFCLIFGYTFIRERFIYASAAGLILVFGYLFISVYATDMPTQTLLQNNTYLFLVNFLGMLIARHIEISARRDFYLEHRLSEEKDKVLHLNEILEHRVEERTRDLETSNAELSSKIEALNRSESERNKLEAQLRQAYKMEAVGTLAGGIAHDFNNMLASILGYTELCLNNVEKGSDMEENLQEVYIAGNRARELVKQILTFARQSEETPKPIRVSSILREVMKLLRSSIPANIEIRSDIQSEANVIGDPINIHQVLMNLATNANHAMEKGGVLEFSTHEVHLDTQDAAAVDGLKPGDYLKLSVSDTGTGIDPDIIGSIFEPYFTTKLGGEGTGMGLAMVYGIVKKYKGGITVDSRPGAGTVFSVYLPMTLASDERELYLAEDLPMGQGNILLVDDELPVATVEKQILSRQGYSVTIQTGSVAALTLFRSNPNAFDMVITDMTMPEMTGDELALELLKIRPDIPVIMLTGYSQKMSEETALKIGIKAFAYKPIVKADLLKKIRDALAS